MKKKIIVANWKMNNGFDETDQWITNFLDLYLQEQNWNKIENIETVVCPPIFLVDYIDNELTDLGFKAFDEIMKQDNRAIESYSDGEITDIVVESRPFKIGAQDCHYAASGSFTGDVSASMLKQLGAEYVIVGHSERRSNHAESNEMIATKVKVAQENGITPIVCIGENQETRNKGEHLDFIYRQLLLSIPAQVKFDKLVIAYEPIWSIGTGIVPTATQIAEVAHFIKEVLAEKAPNIANEIFVIYGGSVDASNSASILAISEIDGLLVGKASLNPAEFADICFSVDAGDFDEILEDEDEFDDLIVEDEDEFDLFEEEDEIILDDAEEQQFQPRKMAYI